MPAIERTRWLQGIWSTAGKTRSTVGAVWSTVNIIGIIASASSLISLIQHVGAISLVGIFKMYIKQYRDIVHPIIEVLPAWIHIHPPAIVKDLWSLSAFLGIPFFKATVEVLEQVGEAFALLPAALVGLSRAVAASGKTATGETTDRERTIAGLPDDQPDRNNGRRPGRPPFSPRAAARKFVGIVQEYGLTRVLFSLMLGAVMYMLGLLLRQRIYRLLILYLVIAIPTVYLFIGLSMPVIAAIVAFRKRNEGSFVAVILRIYVRIVAIAAAASVVFFTTNAFVGYMR
jgi:hypothetical protein